MSGDSGEQAMHCLLAYSSRKGKRNFKKYQSVMGLGSLKTPEAEFTGGAATN